MIVLIKDLNGSVKSIYIKNRLFVMFEPNHETMKVSPVSESDIMSVVWVGDDGNMIDMKFEDWKKEAEQAGFWGII